MANQMLAEVEKALEKAPPSDRGLGAPGTTATLQFPDVLVSTAVCLGVAIVAAVPGWIYLAGSFALYLGLIVVIMAAGFFVARRSPVSAPLAIGYMALLGLMMGAFTHMAVATGSGSSVNTALIAQAVIGTVAGAIATLLIYATPFGKKASKPGKLFLAVMVGYFLLGIANVIAAVLGVGGGWGFYGVGPLGLALCAIGVALACWSLLADIGSADRAIQSGAPRSWQWSLGMALASSIVWLYLEILRLLAILNGR